MAEKWERLTGKKKKGGSQRERDGWGMSEERYMGLVKKIKRGRMREKYKHLAKPKRHYLHTSISKTK